jgi:hypothetical protein
MLASAMNFAIGFFGWPYEDQYQQSITIEDDGVRFPDPSSSYKHSYWLLSSTTLCHHTRHVLTRKLATSLNAASGMSLDGPISTSTRRRSVLERILKGLT